MTRTCLCYNSAINWNELEVDVIKLESMLASEYWKGSISDKLKYHRLKMGWSQFRLAQELCLTEKQGRYLIKDYETRGVFPPQELSITLAKLFNLDTKYFYDDYYEFLDNSNYIITNIRIKNNLSIGEIAKKFGVTKLTWSRWEEGHKPSRKNYQNLKCTFKE